MNNVKWILVIIALFASWVAVFYFGKSTVNIPIQIVASDSLSVQIDTVFVSVPYIKWETRVDPDPASIKPIPCPCEGLVYLDTLKLTDGIKGQIIHATAIDSDLTAITTWEVMIKPVEAIVKEVIRTKTIIEEKIVTEDLQFYENHWFYASVGSWILAILIALGTIL